MSTPGVGQIYEEFQEDALPGEDALRREGHLRRGGRILMKLPAASRGVFA